MEVSVKNQCPRCKKVTTQEMSVEDAVTVEKVSSELEANYAKISAEIKAVCDKYATYPEIMVIATQNDELNIRWYNGLCTGTGSKRSGCSSRVKSLVEDIFMEKESKPKQAKKAKEAKEAKEITQSEPPVGAKPAGESDTYEWTNTE